MIFLQLFLSFFKTGLFAIGGGLATLPFLYEISEKYGWFSAGDIANMLAISESTPGPIGVNMATYAGFTAAGIPGALTATCALILPSLLIVLFVAKAMEKYRNNRFVDAAFLGLRPAVVALITVAFLEVIKVSVLHVEAFLASGKFGALFNFPALILMAALFALQHFCKKIHPIFLIVIGAAAGVLLGL